jgi:predicted site-specific integrase-resolvase
MEDNLLTVFEVAEIFRVGPERIRVWVRTGQLASAVVPTPGRAIRFSERAVRAILNGDSKLREDYGKSR